MILASFLAFMLLHGGVVRFPIFFVIFPYRFAIAEHPKWDRSTFEDIY